MSALTFTHSIRTPGGFVGVVTSDPAGDHALYESASVWPEERQAEVAATWEWFDVIELPRIEDPMEIVR